MSEKEMIEKLLRLEREVQALRSERVPMKQEYTVEEARAMLADAGYSRKEKTIRGWGEHGRIPVVRRGKRIFIRRDTLQALIESGCTLPPPKRLPPSQLSRYPALVESSNP